MEMSTEDTCMPPALPCLPEYERDRWTSRKDAVMKGVMMQQCVTKVYKKGCKGLVSYEGL